MSLAISLPRPLPLPAALSAVLPPRAREALALPAVQLGLGVAALGGLAWLLLGGRRGRAPAAKERVAEGATAAAAGSGGSIAAPAAPASADAAATFTKYEREVLGDMVDEHELTVDFDDVGGLDDQIKTIEELVIFPLSHPHLYAHSAVAQQPTGMLLYGPPGTGKTLLAKAIAKTASAAFLNVNVAHIQSKWFGETPKLVEAVFTLARKVSPCVIFVDEIDGVLSARNDSDMQHVNTMKTKFMEMWDGLTTARNNGGAAPALAAGAASDAPRRDWVLVIGATNKPWALDPAVLRRMPRQLYVGLPDARARAAIMRVLLRRERVAPSLDAELASVAEASEGYSGSDLKELVRAAALIPIREEIQSQRRGAKAAKESAAARRAGASASAAAAPAPNLTRPLVAADLLAALETVKPTGVAAAQYRFAQAGAANSFAVKAGPSSGPSSAPSSKAPATAAAITFGADVPAYMPSASMRLNTRHLTSAIEGETAPKRVLAAVPAPSSNTGTTQGI